MASLVVQGMTLMKNAPRSKSPWGGAANGAFFTFFLSIPGQRFLFAGMIGSIR